MEEKIEQERQRSLYVELPVLLHKILCLSKIPLPVNKDLIKNDIEQIKKITNAECESALEMFKN